MRTLGSIRRLARASVFASLLLLAVAPAAGAQVPDKVAIQLKIDRGFYTNPPKSEAEWLERRPAATLAAELSFSQNTSVLEDLMDANPRDLADYNERLAAAIAATGVVSLGVAEALSSGRDLPASISRAGDRVRIVVTYAGEGPWRIGAPAVRSASSSIPPARRCGPSPPGAR